MIMDETPETTRQALERLAREPVPGAGTESWNSGTSGTAGTEPERHAGTDHEWYAGDGAVPAPRTGGTMPEHVPAPGRALVHLGGAVQVVRVLAQPDVPEIRHALMAYAPAGRYWYDVGTTAADPWGDTDVFHVIKVWFTAEPEEPRGSWVRMYAASGRVTGFPEPATIAATVQGILNSLERLRARGTYLAQTPGQEPPPWPGEPIKTFRPAGRPIKDQPQA